LRKIPVTGGAATTVCKIVGEPRGASWAADDTIIFALSSPSSDLTGLLSVPAAGGEPKVLTKPDFGHEGLHLFPSVLPGGADVPFTITGQATLTPNEDAQIAVLNRQTGQRKTVIRGASQAEYVSTGHLVYAAAGALQVVAFDRQRLAVQANPVTVVPRVMVAETGEANYAVAQNGTLVYVPGGAAVQQIPTRSLVWVNRDGREEALSAPPRPYATARISPDGTQVALDVRDQDSNIWIWSLGSETLRRLTFHPVRGTSTLRTFFETSPMWTPDSRRVVWSSTRAGGNPNVYSQAADGSGSPERLTTTSNPQLATSISPDGMYVLLNEALPGTNSFAVTVLKLDKSSAGAGRPGSTVALMHSSAPASNAEISPDGRWVAYESTESGSPEIYVRPFPNIDDGHWQISIAGGTRPLWAHNGRELFYLDGRNLLMAVPVEGIGPTFKAGKPAKVLDKSYYPGFTPLGVDLRGFDVSPDGRRFLMIKERDGSGESTQPPASMVVILNSVAELNRQSSKP
jgi:serine/threonine-protein kinase